jgi:AraC-like DNA-binding protein
VLDQSKYKIGYAEDGGIFIGKNIQSDFHKHHLTAIVLSFAKPFEIVQENNQSNTYEAALIPKDTLYKLSTSDTDYTVFVHLDPYSELGITLTQKESGIQPLHRRDFLEALNRVKEWFEGTDNTSQRTDYLLNCVVTAVTTTKFTSKKIDERVLGCIRRIRKSDTGTVQLQQMADQIFLSPSRLSHLFKEETGLTFKQFVLHCKLVKSLQAMHHQQNLTEASFVGGFSDQPHFTKTFKKTFGIKPSASKQ